MTTPQPSSEFPKINLRTDANRKPPIRQPYIRWMISSDLREVLAIERASFEFPWGEMDFLTCLKQRNCIGLTAEQGDRVLGFVIYELHKSRLHVLNFAVHPELRRRRVGAAMVGKLQSKLGRNRREIVLEIRESNLAAQLFFRECGFRAVETLRSFYEDSDEDAYVFQFTADELAGARR